MGRYLPVYIINFYTTNVTTSGSTCEVWISLTFHRKVQCFTYIIFFIIHHWYWFIVNKYLFCLLTRLIQKRKATFNVKYIDLRHSPRMTFCPYVEIKFWYSCGFIFSRIHATIPSKLMWISPLVSSVCMNDPGISANHNKYLFIYVNN